MPESCAHCGHPTVVVPDCLSPICTVCGTLADPSQTVLANDDAFTEQASTAWRHTFDAVRHGLTGRDDKASRNKRNTTASHAYIHALATQVGHPALATRAQGLFDRATYMAKYKSGRSAKLAAGASLAIALREANKAEALTEIAYILDESPIALSRRYKRLLDLLNVPLGPSSAIPFLAVLQSHVQALLQVPHGAFPAPLLAALTSASPPAVLSLASALAAQVPVQGSAALNACAFYLLAIEGVLLRKLPNYQILTDHLAKRVAVGVSGVNARYNALYLELHARIVDIPWLRVAAPKRKAQRGKVDERDAVARALSDIVKFHDESARVRMHRSERPTLLFEPDEDADESDANSDEDSPTRPRSPLLQRKRRRDRMQDASVGLISGTIPVSAEHSKLQAFLLTCDDSLLPGMTRAAPPTRLQLLTVERGGEADVVDDELFGEGELDAILRADDEVEDTRRLLEERWEGFAPAPPRKRKSAPCAPKVKRTRAVGGWELKLGATLAEFQSSISQEKTDQVDDPVPEESDGDTDEDADESERVTVDSLLGDESYFMWHDDD